MSRLRCLILSCALAAASPIAGAAGEQAPPARLAVTVLDQTGLVIPRASVTLFAPGAAPDAAGVREASSNGFGVAIFEGVAEGRYDVRVEFAGFQPALLENVRVRRGRENRVRAVLQIERRDEEVTVARDRQTSSLDPRGSAFSS
ncbi:MAG TPA: carboxypeptidase-like regulatory domain-containing protein, partial [Vicinamibacterales bacterium]|nr:carboxypeptidase-like regulatory domain-containing protein [Vicinamibacterales bacterium]